MILHDKERARHFVAGILGFPADHFDKCHGLVVVRGNEIVAGTLYHDWHLYENGSTIQASIASIHPRWATKEVLREMFAYPFETVGVNLLRVCCRRSNTRARRFVQRLHFKYEGMARCEWDGVEDVASYSMTREEAIRFGWIEDGQEHTESTAAA